MRMMEEDETFAYKQALRDYMRTGEVSIETKEMFRAAFWAKTRVLIKAYNPDQPRVPAGQQGGGQFTSGEGGSTHELTSHDIIEGGDGREFNRYNVDLSSHEGGFFKGHTLKEHVAIDRQNLIDRVDKDKGQLNLFGWGSLEWASKSSGSFENLESANYYVNKVVNQNKDVIDYVVDNKIYKYTTIDSVFSSSTGYEAFRDNIYGYPYIRDTFRVRAVIRYDANSLNGYTIITSYPHNRD